MCRGCTTSPSHRRARPLASEVRRADAMAVSGGQVEVKWLADPGRGKDGEGRGLRLVHAPSRPASWWNSGVSRSMPRYVALFAGKPPAGVEAIVLHLGIGPPRPSRCPRRPGRRRIDGPSRRRRQVGSSRRSRRSSPESARRSGHPCRPRRARVIGQGPLAHARSLQTLPRPGPPGLFSQTQPKRGVQVVEPGDGRGDGKAARLVCSAGRPNRAASGSGPSARTSSKAVPDEAEGQRRDGDGLGDRPGGDREAGRHESTQARRDDPVRGEPPG